MWFLKDQEPVNLNRPTVFTLLGCVALLLGCGGSGTSPVTGKAMLDGSPMPENTRIQFEPAGGVGESAAGIVDASGNYELFSGASGEAGALPGKYKVYVTADASTEGYMEGPQRGGGVPGVAVGPFPKEYTSPATTPIEKEVSSGPNQIDIEIPGK